MGADGKVITAKLPEALAARLDDVAERIGRTRSWIMREALGEWLTEEDRRHELTLKALEDADEGRAMDHAEFTTWSEQLKADARANHPRAS